MTKSIWLMLLMLVVAACGGATTAAPGTSVEAGDLDLSGLTLDVHQAPG